MSSLLIAQSFTPSTTAVAGNVFLTAIVGLLPLVVFFVLMGVSLPTGAQLSPWFCPC